MIRDVLTDAVGPAVVARLLDHVVLDAALRAAGRAPLGGIGTVVAHQHPAGLLVDVDPERVPEAHRVDLGQGLVVGVVGLVEEVVGRDRVRGADPRHARGVRDRADAQDLAVRVVRVGRRALSVEVLAARPLVGRIEAVRERVRVVARGDVQVAVGPEVERAAGVAAALALMLPGVDDLLLAERGAGQREARHAVDPGVVRECRVGEVEVAGRLEVRGELDAQQAVLMAERDRNRADGRGRLRGRRPHLHAAVELDVEGAAVLGDVDLHRRVGVVVERDLLEVRRGRRHRAFVIAAVGGEAGRGAQAAQQVLAEVGLGERRLGVAHRRVPGAAAVEVRAPRDGVVVVDRVAVLLVVRRLVDRGQDLHVASARAEVGDRRAAVDDGGRRVLEVVPLVRTRPAGREAGGRGLVRHPRCRPQRWAFRAGGCGSSRRPVRRTTATSTRCPTLRGRRRSRRRPG